MVTWVGHVWMRPKPASFWPPETMRIKRPPMNTPYCDHGLSKILLQMCHNTCKYSGMKMKCARHAPVMFKCADLVGHNNNDNNERKILFSDPNINCTLNSLSMSCAKTNSSMHYWPTIAHVPEPVRWWRWYCIRHEASKYSIHVSEIPINVSQTCRSAVNEIVTKPIEQSFGCI